jgi:hypothetical protein
MDDEIVKMMWLLHTVLYGVNITLFGVRTVYQVESSLFGGQ